MGSLHMFSAGSANDSWELQLAGASQFIIQLNKLLDHIKYNFEILDVNDFKTNHLELGEILKNNKSDKSLIPWHNYHIFYAYVFDKLGRNSMLNILEIGLGTNNPNLPSYMGDGARPGASLYAWREYFPNSNIYGGDIDKDILFEDDRIKTFYLDQLDIKTFQVLPDIKYDLIIDDGLHSIGANFNTLLYALDHINLNGWIIIEDISIQENWRAIDFILQSTRKYKTHMICALRGYIYAIQKIM